MPLGQQETLREFGFASGRSGHFYSLPALEATGVGKVSRLPVSLRIVLESLLRNFDGKRITEDHVHQLANWQPQAARTEEIPFVVARIVLQDFTGVPLLCDLAAMRDVAVRFGKNPRIIEPLVPVDLVVDHSVQVDHFRESNALDLNMRLEFRRNAERYRFIKWGMQAFDTFRVVPPGVGIVHQVNLEYLTKGVNHRDGVYFPDMLVGTDSHTTMINALGVVGWGVGGIEAEAGMLGQPVYILTPDVVGVHLSGRLGEGVTATDLVLVVTEALRKAKVVGKFVEFFGEGAASLTLPDRATIANMTPEYGATIGFFPPDEETVNYLSATGRSDEEVDAFCSYFQAQQLFGMPRAGEINYSNVLELDLASVVPCVAGPKRPQDRIVMPELKRHFAELLSKPTADGGYGKANQSHAARYALSSGGDVGHGDILIAAITSCTNTSNPGVMLAAGLLAQKAVARGLRVPSQVKTSLAPGSRVVSEYLGQAGLLAPLEQLGFRVVAYGCTTCIGNAGPLDPEIERLVSEQDLICASVLSGNRNFEARIHAGIKANFLMSPPLVVAFALAGRIGIDLSNDPLAFDNNGVPVYLHEIWPSQEEVGIALRQATDPETYRRLYKDFARDNPLWEDIAAVTGEIYVWDPSTYIARPPFFDDFALEPPPLVSIRGARALAIFGDSVTTDHISPAGSIKGDSPAGIYLRGLGVTPDDFNSYGSRRGNHEVMMRGTFANVRIRNLMLPPGMDGRPVEGGLTLTQPDGVERFIYDAAMDYQLAGTPTLIFSGEEYGTGSSRDWAAKGTRLLGVKAVVAKGFERIHRSNLVGMGVLPLQFKGQDSAASLGLRGDEIFDVVGTEDGIAPGKNVTLHIRHADGHTSQCSLLMRIDTPIEVDYYCNGGILPYVLRGLFSS
ncbi:MAG: aconitate hydratase [Gammaproteobacteria bacterium (ex Lamellibrachia satsuma)]|nr:MAG: aconitate hydratase AcnA [Gammaproteobacteria bacterium (ex Lamellibrachia satsuma)]RRS35994.1 MAG: aconitate hydratase [Gammaproteobacteria bacterium (ex Lamellibrachia satsuma)]RRS36586.1 MAG: aconitate hydratase [Gammaproteobacteria bacterium (ex Lamellibrachia satsuma)]